VPRSAADTRCDLGGYPGCIGRLCLNVAAVDDHHGGDNFFESDSYSRLVVGVCLMDDNIIISLAGSLWVEACHQHFLFC